MPELQQNSYCNADKPLDSYRAGEYYITRLTCPQTTAAFYFAQAGPIHLNSNC